MPQYKKYFDIGTYTGNGGQYRVGIPTKREVGPSGKQVSNSLRFKRNTTYLSKTFGSAGNRKTWTYSVWLKKSVNTAASQQNIFSAYAGSLTDTTYFHAYFNTDDTLYVDLYTTRLRLSVAKFKDTSRWYHFVFAMDTSQATAANRFRVYVDGQEITSWTTNNAPTLNADYAINSNIAHGIGYDPYQGTTNYMFEGYMTEINFIGGLQLDPTYFGEYNSDGIWVPKGYSGSYGTNGFYLNFADNGSLTALGGDFSGNGNNWTTNGFSLTAGVTYDSMTDSPTDYLSGSMTTANNAGNYCTFSRVHTNSRVTVSAGNLNITKDSFVDWNTALGTQWLSAGKWYWEFTLGTTVNVYFIPGFVRPTFDWTNISQYPGKGSSDYGIDGNTGKKRTNDAVTTYGSAYATGSVVMLAIDFDLGKIWFGKDGQWANGTGSFNQPWATANVAFTGVTGTLIPAVGMYTSENGVANFGQRPFAYTPPTGFNAVNTYNYPRPAASSMWFYGDTPDLMWIKNRSTTGLHTITDTVRGAGLNLVTSSTAADASYPAVTEINKFGMTVINDATSIVNGSTNSHVYWGWKAGGATVTNTSGTITSQVSVNKQSGFSIVSYTGNGTGGATVGHGLGVAPKFLILKSRSYASGNWVAWHKSQPDASYALWFNTTNGNVSYPSAWNSVAPTSTTFSLGTATETNGSGYTFIAYLWSEIAGYSSFGSYTGNGSADGPFVHTGFRPKWIMFRRLDSTADWFVYDYQRNVYNPVTLNLNPNTTAAETNTGAGGVDLLSNGFKLRDTSLFWNASSGSYAYAAFAEIPFNFARAR